MKKIIAIIITAVLLVSFGLSANAVVPENEVMPLWENTSSVINAMGFNGTTGTVSCSIVGDSGTTITAIVRVYRQTEIGGWTYIGGKRASSDTRWLDFSMTYGAIEGFQYKAVLEATVTKNGVDEVITKTSYKTCPNS